MSSPAAMNPNLHLMAEYNNLWRPSHIEQADKVLHESFVRHGSSGALQGIPAFKRYVRDFLRAFPDIRFTVEDCVAQGEKIVLRYGFTGTHQGDFLGVPATGNKVKVEGVAIYRIAQGKLVELHDFLDLIALARQLGVPTAFQP